MTYYYIYGTVNRIYYCITNRYINACKELENAKKYFPGENWQILTGDQEEGPQQ